MEKSVNPFVPIAPFLYPLKPSENLVFDVFRGYRKGALGTNGFTDFFFFFSGLLKTKLVAHEDLIMSLNWNKKGDYLLSASIDKVSASQ